MLDEPGRRLLSAITKGAAGTLGAAVFFGSRSSGVVTNSASAYDLMLVCESPRAFFRAAQASALLARSPLILAMADRFLAPTQIRLSGEGLVAKASVVSFATLRLATSRDRKDQFLAGRMFQDVHLVWADGETSSERVAAAIEGARRLTFDWVGPDLPAAFDARDYLIQVFRTSFRFEVRPEGRGRADALSAVQAERLVPVFERVLEGLADEGKLVRLPPRRFRVLESFSRGRRLPRRLFMEWSRVRATLRWPKHAITFDGWLDYIIRKAERHSGEVIVLTAMERRLPFIFVWPRVVRFLLRQRRKST